MDEPDAGAKPGDLEPRPPLEADLVGLCRQLNQRGARYVVIGDFAVIAAGLPQVTGDIDLMVAVDSENEAKVFSALATLPDNAVSELQPDELQRYNVIRVADDIIVDLMRTAGGIEYEEAAKDIVVRELCGVAIPFAAPRLLWRMKVVTHREKDAGDLVFLRYWFQEHGEEPPN